MKSVEEFIPGTIDRSRRGEWGCTYTGRQYWPSEPRPEDIQIEDVAHALSLQCRFGGHCVAFYSVAQHSVHVSQFSDVPDRLWGLLHDASEAYLVDLPRPVKQVLPAYRVLEQRMMAAVCNAFGLPLDMPGSVRHADEAMLTAEAYALMPPRSVQHWTLPVPAAPINLDLWSPMEAEARFLERFRELRGGR
jgi:hypothetical protein